MGNVAYFKPEHLYRLVGVYVLFMSSLHAVIGELCSFPEDPCICHTSTFVLNLKPLMDAMNGVDFTDTGEEGLYNYYVQPCNKKLTSQLPECNGVSADLIVYNSLSLAYGLGVLNKFDASKSGNDFVLKNTYKGDFVERSLNLTIRCSDQEAVFSYNGNNQQINLNIYNFMLSTRYVCEGYTVEASLSPGSVMVIIFFVLIFVYFIGGALFQKFAKKAQGTEIVPNVTFWAVLPALVKDGVMFVFRGCK